MAYTHDTYRRSYEFDFARPRSRRERIARIDALATLLDTALIVPILNLRFGLDAVLGLVPGIGDLLPRRCRSTSCTRRVSLALPPFWSRVCWATLRSTALSERCRW